MKKFKLLLIVILLPISFSMTYLTSEKYGISAYFKKKQALDDLKKENVDALKKGIVNLERHINNIKKFNLPVAVAVNHFITDTDKEVNALINFCNNLKVKVS